jgi:hypothetical protein
MLANNVCINTSMAVCIRIFTFTQTLQGVFSLKSRLLNTVPDTRIIYRANTFCFILLPYTTSSLRSLANKQLISRQIPPVIYGCEPTVGHTTHTHKFALYFFYSIYTSYRLHPCSVWRIHVIRRLMGITGETHRIREKKRATENETSLLYIMAGHVTFDECINGFISSTTKEGHTE